MTLSIRCGRDEFFSRWMRSNNIQTVKTTRSRSYPSRLTSMCLSRASLLNWASNNVCGLLVLRLPAAATPTPAWGRGRGRGQGREGGRKGDWTSSFPSALTLTVTGSGESSLTVVFVKLYCPQSALIRVSDCHRPCWRASLTVIGLSDCHRPRWQASLTVIDHVGGLLWQSSTTLVGLSDCHRFLWLSSTSLTVVGLSVIGLSDCHRFLDCHQYLLLSSASLTVIDHVGGPLCLSSASLTKCKLSC